MSIAPIEGISATRTEQVEQASVGSGNSQSRPEPSAPTVSGNSPEQESSVAKNDRSTYELPVDVVEVHQDPDIKNQIIVQYLNPTGGVIMQVPSTQELSVERGIAQEFQESAKLRAVGTAPNSGSEGENKRGN
jgi:hypothetical protein